MLYLSRTSDVLRCYLVVFQASLAFRNCDEYEGDFVEGARHGHGELKFFDGSIYEGQWRADMCNGQGSVMLFLTTYKSRKIAGFAAHKICKASPLFCRHQFLRYLKLFSNCCFIMLEWHTCCLQNMCLCG